eukprot:scaffold68648_cov32-Tisochrysis_lutea.AAC.2
MRSRAGGQRKEAGAVGGGAGGAGCADAKKKTDALPPRADAYLHTCAEETAREVWLSKANVTGRLMGSFPAADSASLRSVIHLSNVAIYSANVLTSSPSASSASASAACERRSEWVWRWARSTGLFVPIEAACAWRRFSNEIASRPLPLPLGDNLYTVLVLPARQIPTHHNSYLSHRLFVAPTHFADGRAPALCNLWPPLLLWEIKRQAAEESHHRSGATADLI